MSAAGTPRKAARVAGIVLLLDHDVVSVEDAGVDHGLTAHAQDERAGVAHDAGGQRKCLFDVLLGKDGRACGDAAHQGQVHLVARRILDRGGQALGVGGGVRHHLDGAGLLGVALDEPALLKHLKVHVHR